MYRYSRSITPWCTLCWQTLKRKHCLHNLVTFGIWQFSDNQFWSCPWCCRCLIGLATKRELDPRFCKNIWIYSGGEAGRDLTVGCITLTAQSPIDLTSTLVSRICQSDTSSYSYLLIHTPCSRNNISSDLSFALFANDNLVKFKFSCSLSFFDFHTSKLCQMHFSHGRFVCGIQTRCSTGTLPNCLLEDLRIDLVKIGSF